MSEAYEKKKLEASQLRAQRYEFFTLAIENAKNAARSPLLLEQLQVLVGVLRGTIGAVASDLGDAIGAADEFGVCFFDDPLTNVCSLSDSEIVDLVDSAELAPLYRADLIRLLRVLDARWPPLDEVTPKLR